MKKSGKITIIAAMGEDRTIGKRGGLPWHLPADLKRFKRLTMDKTVIMGRKTFRSMDGPLEGRRNIVMSRKEGFSPEGAERARSVDEALEIACGGEVFILGGGEIYRRFLPFADRMYITLIHHTFDGDTFFPPFDRENWKEVFRENRRRDDLNPYNYTFLEYERINENGND